MHRPQLGDRVTFTHYWDRPNQDEVEARVAELEGEEGTIELVRRENPTPAKPAIVVGYTAATCQGHIGYDWETSEPYVDWHTTARRRFYMVKHDLRGRRYLVEAEALEEVPEDA